MKYDALLEDILTKLSGYSRVRRKNTQPFHREVFQSSWIEYDPDNELLREWLIEHVWSLPILATCLFPYIWDLSVDLWDALIMLAVHDIWELKVWDEIWFLKKDNKEEINQAKKMLPSYYHTFYDDIESQSSSTWMFAKSVDKFAPEFLDILCDPDITIQRYRKHMNIWKEEIVDFKRSHKAKYMERNEYIHWFFLYVCDHLEQRLIAE